MAIVAHLLFRFSRYHMFLHTTIHVIIIVIIIVITIVITIVIVIVITIIMNKACWRSSKGCGNRLLSRLIGFPE